MFVGQFEGRKSVPLRGFHTLQHENTRVAWCEQNRTDATEIGFISFADAAAANMIHISAVFCLLQVFALPAPLT